MKMNNEEEGVKKQDRIHGKSSCVRLGRGSDAKAAQKTPKKQMRYQPIDQTRDRPTN